MEPRKNTDHFVSFSSRLDANDGDEKVIFGTTRSGGAVLECPLARWRHWQVELLFSVRHPFPSLPLVSLLPYSWTASFSPSRRDDSLATVRL